MRVLLMRHAHAVDEGVGLPDDARWLTEKGRETARRVGEALRELGVTLDDVLCSPLVRAVQTAELVAAATGFKGPVEAVTALGMHADPHRLDGELETRGGTVLAVGHEPGIPAIAAHLTGQRGFPSFTKGQLVCIEHGHARFSIDPKTAAVHHHKR